MHLLGDISTTIIFYWTHDVCRLNKYILQYTRDTRSRETTLGTLTLEMSNTREIQQEDRYNNNGGRDLRLVYA